MVEAIYTRGKGDMIYASYGLYPIHRVSRLPRFIKTTWVVVQLRASQSHAVNSVLRSIDYPRVCTYSGPTYKRGKHYKTTYFPAGKVGKSITRPGPQVDLLRRWSEVLTNLSTKSTSPSDGPPNASTWSLNDYGGNALGNAPMYVRSSGILPVLGQMYSYSCFG